MDGLWILLGAALSTISGVVFWFLNSWTARGAQERQRKNDAETQERQQAHDASMQERQHAYELQHSLEQDRREAARALRRERIRPIQEFLDATKAFVAEETFMGSSDELYEKNINNIQQHMTLDEFRKMMSKAGAESAPDVTEWFRQSVVALSTATDLDVRKALLDVARSMEAIAAEPKARTRARRALRAAEQVIDEYLLNGGEEDPS